jgi:hypothetical protein
VFEGEIKSRMDGLEFETYNTLTYLIDAS